MRDLKAFLLGALSAGALAYALMATMALTAQAGGRTLDVALGAVMFVSVETDRTGTVTTFGPGLFALALGGGLVNLGAAYLVRRRSARRVDRVD